MLIFIFVTFYQNLDKLKFRMFDLNRPQDIFNTNTPTKLIGKSIFKQQVIFVEKGR